MCTHEHTRRCAHSVHNCSLGPYAWSTNSLPIANGTISPYLLTLAYRYVSAIIPLTSLLGLHAYGPWNIGLHSDCFRLAWTCSSVTKLPKYSTTNTNYRRYKPALFIICTHKCPFYLCCEPSRCSHSVDKKLAKNRDLPERLTTMYHALLLLSFVATAQAIDYFDKINVAYFNVRKNLCFSHPTNRIMYKSVAFVYYQRRHCNIQTCKAWAGVGFSNTTTYLSVYLYEHNIYYNYHNNVVGTVNFALMRLRLRYNWRHYNVDNICMTHSCTPI